MFCGPRKAAKDAEISRTSFALSTCKTAAGKYEY